MKKVNEEKYKDDLKFEPWADINIFFPLARKLIGTLHDLNFTPNMVTYLSTFFTIFTVYFLNYNNNEYAAFSYFIGYLLDNCDGLLARRYNMVSDKGMVLDLTLNNVSNFILFGYIIYNYQMNEHFIYIIIFISALSYILALSYGLNEAISSFEYNGSDNFYRRKYLQIKKYLDKPSLSTYDYILYKSFLFLIKYIYKIYKFHFPVYNKNDIENKLSYIKQGGPGNYAICIIIILLYLHKPDSNLTNQIITKI